MTFLNQYPNLRYRAIGSREPGESISGNGELTNADKANPNWEIVMIPQANWPIAMTPLAMTGNRFERYLNETWTSGSPIKFFCDLYSNPHPSHLSFAGYRAPQWAQVRACSEILLFHSLHGFTLSPFNQRLQRSYRHCEDFLEYNCFHCPQFQCSSTSS
jgi:hypothetical protein